MASGLSQRQAKVLVLGATSKVSEQLQFAQHVVLQSVQNSRTVPTSARVTSGTRRFLWATRLSQVSCKHSW